MTSSPSTSASPTHVDSPPSSGLDDEHIVGWGIMGAASIARKNARAIYKSPSSHLRALASRDINKAKSFISEVAAARLPQPHKGGGNVKPLEGYSNLLLQPNIDIIYCPLPTSLHTQWMSSCMAAKKHVLSEKPAFLNIHDALPMLESFKSSNLQFMDGTMFMHHDRFHKLMELLHVDPLTSTDEINRVDVSFCFKADEAFLKGGNIRTQIDGDPLGCIGDVGWYAVRLGLATWGWEWPVSVRARAAKTTPEGIPMDVTGEIYWDEPNQSDVTQTVRTLHFHCSFLHGYRQNVEILGKRRRFYMDDFCNVRSEAQAILNMETFPIEGPQQDEASKTITRHDAFTFNNVCQEANMVEHFTQLTQNISKRKMAPEPFWSFTAFQTQGVCDAIMDSIKQDGQLIRMEEYGPKMWKQAPPFPYMKHVVFSNQEPQTQKKQK